MVTTRCESESFIYAKIAVKIRKPISLIYNKLIFPKATKKRRTFIKGTTRTRVTFITRMLLVMPSKMVIAVSSSFLVLLLLSGTTTSVVLSAFNNEDDKATTVNDDHRGNIIVQDASDTISINKQQEQSNFFDAMALFYVSSKEVVKERTTNKKKNTIMKQKNSFRQLNEGDGGLLAKRTFPECIEQSLSPEECQALIEEQIVDAGGHEVGDVNVKIHTPRTPEQFAESYWMIEVPVNLYNKMACDRNNGETFYPFEWTDFEGGGSTFFEPGGQDCFGLTAGECCLEIRIRNKILTETGYDVNQNCLSCFVHQEPLEPIFNEETGETDYLECKDLGNGTCVQEQLTSAEVDALDLRTVGRIETAIAFLESFLSNRSCYTFEELLEKLYNAASVIYPLSMKIGRLSCSVCYGEFDLDLEGDMVTSMLEEILMILKKNSPPEKEINSKENCIIIYTNSDGEVVMEPTLGGSRSTNVTGKVPVTDDLCQGDADCNDTEWCAPDGNCLENVCITNPPADCQGKKQLCEPSPHDYYDYYTCTTIDCTIDPYFCGENAICLGSFNEYDELVYTCSEYKDTGEKCGYSYYGEYYGQAKFDGECDPDVSFCLEPFECTYTNSPYIAFARRCVAYGEGSCRDATTRGLTQANCKSDEYCDNANERCKPNRNQGECCDPDLNNCGYGSELGTLICAPDINYVDYYDYYLIDHYVCEKVCETDDDCDNDEWCAPVDETNDPPKYPGKFCKQYKGLNDYCTTKVPGVDKEFHTEERCDPSNSYCYDPAFCFPTSNEYYSFQSQCRLYGNVCTEDSDCADDRKEWCDVDSGYCKDRFSDYDCCTTAGDDSKNDCSPDSKCEFVEYYSGFSSSFCFGD